MEDVTLAQFVSQYTLNRKGEYVERNEPRVIRYKNYDMTVDFNEYKREVVTLHIPFRSEEQEILAEMKFNVLYEVKEEIIFQRRKEFEANVDIDKSLQICSVENYVGKKHHFMKKKY